MKQEERIRRLMATFVDELDGRVRAMSDDLVLLEQAISDRVRTEAIDSLLRSVHSLKGAAQSVRIEDIEIACHLLEELLIALKRPRVADDLRADLVALLVSTNGAFADAALHLRTGAEVGEPQLKKLLPHLENAAHDLQLAAADEDSPATIRDAASDDDDSHPAKSSDSRMNSGRDVSAPLPSPPPGSRRQNHFEEIRWQLEQLTRDLSAEAGKRIDFELGDRSGAALLVADAIDSTLAERLADPLRHLVKNAVHHGIELPDERIAAGKPEVGRIELQARVADARLEIAVRDDGRGLDRVALATTARRLGHPVPDSDEEVERLAYLAGLSTTAKVTRRSGRGIGLDAVRARTESLGGTLSHHSVPGRGAAFLLSIPLASAAMQALLVFAGGRLLALPGIRQNDVREVKSSDLRWILGRPVALVEEELLPIAPLDRLIESRHWLEELSRVERESPPVSGQAVILRHEEQRMLLAIDKVGACEDLALQPLGHRLSGIECVAGVSLTGNGELALVLDLADLARRLLETRPRTSDPRASVSRSGDRPSR